MADHNTPLTNKEEIVNTVPIKTFFQSKKQIQGAVGSGTLAGLTAISIDQLAALGAPWPVIVVLILVSALPSILAQVSETWIDLKRQVQRTPEIPHNTELGDKK